MPIFPNSEREAVALCAKVVDGLRKRPQDFPQASESFEALRVAYEAYREAKTEQRRLRRDYNDATERKNDALSALVPLMKQALRLAESDAEDRPEALRGLGWAPPRPRGRPRKEPEQRPGSPVDLVAEPGIGAAFSGARLKWRPAPEGGEPSHYEIERRIEGGAWELAGTLPRPPAPGPLKIKMFLDQQPLGVEMEYRVVAANWAGRSDPSNEATIFLRPATARVRDWESKSGVDEDNTTAAPDFKKPLFLRRASSGEVAGGIY
jgi:hypothetical protein